MNSGMTALTFPFPGSVQGRRRFLKNLAGLAAAGLAARSTGRVWAAPAQAPDQPLPIIVDADTANEIDDAFALTRALTEPRFQVEGITSAQWHTQDEGFRDTVGPS